MTVRLFVLFIVILAPLAACGAPSPTEQPTPPPSVEAATAPTIEASVPTATAAAPATTVTPEPSAAAVHSDAEIAAEIETLMGNLVDAGLFNGVVLVAHDGQVLFSQGYGMADREK